MRGRTLAALPCVVALTLAACRAPVSTGVAPGGRIAEAEAAARQAIAVEAQLRPDTLSARTVGVLPFDQSGMDTSAVALGYGLADLLRVDLAKSSQLRVVDRLRLDAIMRELQLAASGRADSSTAPRVGRLVQARQMVYGALQADTNRMGIQVGVADAATRQLRGAVATELRLNDILDAEKQIALRLFESLGVTLTPAERVAVEERPTKNLAAFLAYGRGVRYETELRFADAASEYRNALALDPNFTLASTRLEEVAELSAESSGSRRASLARAAGAAVDRLNGVFTSPLGGPQPPGAVVDPAFPAPIITIVIVVSTPR